MTGRGEFFEGEGLKNHDHVQVCRFERRPESVINEALEVVAGGGEFAHFFGDNDGEAPRFAVGYVGGVREIKDCKVGGCDSFGAGAEPQKFGAKRKFAGIRNHRGRDTVSP